MTATPGTHAELVAAKEENVFAIPESLDTAAAAALGTPYTVAWWSLVDLGGLKDGDTLLVQGASTGTGQASVDIGRSLGAKVYATSRPEKLDHVRALGAEPLAYGESEGPRARGRCRLRPDRRRHFRGQRRGPGTGGYARDTRSSRQPDGVV